MSPRRRRRFNFASIAVMLLAVVAGAALLSVYFRAKEPGSAPMADPDLRVEVLNGCGSRGAADRVALLLRREGFLVEKVGNADHFHYREDIVVARTVDRERLLDLGRALGGAAVVEQQIPDYEYQVTVIVGKPRSLVDMDS